MRITVDTWTAVASVLIAVDRRTKLIARCIDRLIDAPFFSEISPFLSYPMHLCLAPPRGVTPSEFREDLDIHKTRMNASCGEESMTIYVQPF